MSQSKKKVIVGEEAEGQHRCQECSGDMTFFKILALLGNLSGASHLHLYSSQQGYTVTMQRVCGTFTAAEFNSMCVTYANADPNALVCACL